MTRVVPSAMMFATISGCAQTAVVRAPKAEAKSAGRAPGGADARQTSGRGRRRRGSSKKS